MKYYLFAINDDFYNDFKNKPKVIYDMLNRIRVIGNDYGVSVYKQICSNINTDLINNYLNKKFYSTYKSNKHIINNNVIAVRPSCIMVVGYSGFPPFLKYLNFYNKKFFVCNFEKNNYFWLYS